MKWSVCIAALAAAVLHGSALAQTASLPPAVERIDWVLRVSKHLVSHINASKPQLRAALKAARSSGQRDVSVKIGLVVSRNGRIQAAEVAMSSGIPDVDRITTSIVARAGRVPAMPASFPGETRRLMLPVRLQL